MKEVNEDDTFDDRLFRIFRCFLLKSSEDDLLSLWTPETLSMAATELARKSVFLSAKLQIVLNNQPLLPLNKETKRLEFNVVFLQLVQAYHAGVQRPKGTFNLDTEDSQEGLQDIDSNQNIAETENETDFIQLSNSVDAINIGNGENALVEAEDIITNTLAAIPREVCPLCGGRRQIYCGDCGGVRMDGANNLLPPRVQLPFDVLLIVHWAEDLHKCTGVQAAALCQDGSVTYADWSKTRPRKLSFLCEEPKKKWERMEKKEYNAIKDSNNISKDSNNVSKDSNNGSKDSSYINNSDSNITNTTIDIIAKIKNDKLQSNIGKQYNRRGNKKSVHTNITTENLLDIPNGNFNKKKIDITEDNDFDNLNPNSDISGGLNPFNLSDIDDKWGAMVCALHPQRDVLLFPSDDAVYASKFDWDSRVGTGPLSQDSINGGSFPVGGNKGAASSYYAERLVRQPLEQKSGNDSINAADIPDIPVEASGGLRW
eukprot:CAMPEP_0119053806 /NCGR_PEP_ID=MMETSP1177-20130426/74662_1 /TAXON_ID=2985 /ORGANISM="Ochromonas sp, Strain CCMP1899" /LENGTH=484 /DNA_ID=CAMNT_0007033859 /DNA_START=471 /DNA_END=1922 /DNA_ORIENTATION=-